MENNLEIAFKTNFDLIARLEEAERIREEKIKKHLKQAEQGAKNLGQWGWTLPGQFYPEDFIEMDLKNFSLRELEEVFEEFYTHNDSAWTKSLFNDLLTVRPILSKWVPLLEEATKSHFDGRYRIVIPAILSIMEGVIMDNTVGITNTNTKLSGPLSKHLFPCENIIGKLYRTNLLSFIETLWCKSSFDQAVPLVINRHWILHGRDTSQWAIADALRCFSGLHSLAIHLEYEAFLKNYF